MNPTKHPSADRPLTLYEKLWKSHVVAGDPDGTALIYIDRHLVQEVSSPQAFSAARERGLKAWRPEANLVVADHAIPTTVRNATIEEPLARAQVGRLEENAAAFGLPYTPVQSRRQGIVHVIGPEEGFTLPGATLVCGDSHTSTHGAFGALAFGIGSSECGTALTTQCLWQKKAPTLRITVSGTLSPFVTAKDLALYIIAEIGTSGARGCAVEYAGSAITGLDMAGRMTLCNMAIESGARIGLIAPDETTFSYIEGRRLAPRGKAWDEAVSYWRSLPSDEGAVFDREIAIDASEVQPFVTWGTTPEDALPVTGHVPLLESAESAEGKRALQRKLDYMGLEPDQSLSEIEIDKVFIGSCTNSRIEDLRAAAAIVEGRKVSQHVQAMVVPGSTLTKLQAEVEGLDQIFLEAGFEWRHSGCSMCVAMNDDRLKPGERCASTSNRNFEGRQGQGGRTHLMSPAMAAAAAIAGKITDVRKMEAAK
ncbi:3-isopropylmalate dehydratase large subunit [Henriciella sp. AS95]|uniref:3-isopropylmalate dehydratase large subunit n=1 Tax=Henriciella sp. AS95 TaxID=3135782 RepID=UPI00316C3F25